MATSDCFVSVVAPLFNDADIVDAFIEDVIGTLKREYANYELVLVEGGSRDNTVEKVSAQLKKHKCIRLIRLSKHFGQDAAITAGLDSVIGDFVVIIMPETDPPEQIPEILEKCRRGSGIVYGIRKHRKREPFYLRCGASVYYWLLNRIMKIDIPKNTADFRALSRQALNSVIKFRDRLCYLRFFSTHIGYGVESFEYEPVYRRQTPKFKSFREAVHLAFSLIVANTTHPLRLVSILGFSLSFLSLLYMVYVVIVRLWDENVVPGWATQSLQISGMFFFLFMILAMLCEYVGNLLEEIRGRPSYFVLEERNSSVLLVDENRKNVMVESKPQNVVK